VKTVVLAGGTGGAKLASGFQSLLPPGDLTVIANTADDDEFFGLLVCPDVDAAIYRLADEFDDEAGYGRKGDTFATLDALSKLGEPSWFRIGDLDFATHLVRSGLLDRGCSLTEATLDICRRFGLSTRVLPMSDHKVRTRFTTDRGELSFQEYFVRERLAPLLRSIAFDGIASATPTQDVVAALAASELVVIGPSNPLISVGPILQVLGPLMNSKRTVAVSPIVGGIALKGPTVEMLRAVGFEATPLEVARSYKRFAGTFFIDSRDAGDSHAIEELGYTVIVTDTVMIDGGIALAKALLEAG